MTVIYAYEDASHANATPLSHLRTKGIAGNRPMIVRPNTSFRMVSKLRFPKQHPDAFSNSQLNTFLREKVIDHLFIVGMDGMTSIRQTACSALNRHYRVTLIADGIFTTSENRWQQQLRSFESAAAFAITSEEFIEFCQRLHKGAVPEPASHAGE
jgi:nicotinamidase-related amidase